MQREKKEIEQEGTKGTERILIAEAWPSVRAADGWRVDVAVRVWNSLPFDPSSEYDIAMIELTPQQRREVEQAEKPVAVLDVETKREYVLVRREIYERLQKIMEIEEVDPSFYECDESPL